MTGEIGKIDKSDGQVILRQFLRNDYGIRIHFFSSGKYNNKEEMNDLENSMPECENAIYSDEYFDFIVAKQDVEMFVNEDDVACIQELDEQFVSIYYRPPAGSTLNLRDYTYISIPKCFGLLNYDALESSGIMKVRDQPNLMLTGQGVLIGFVDTEERVIILS